MIKVTKRDGSSENFSVQTLKNAIKEAFKSAKVKQSREIINAVANAVQPYDGIPVEEIQDQIENSLMLHNYAAVAKEFILYRNRKKEIREFTNRKLAYIERYKQSANTANATVDDNSNVACKNIGVLNAEIHKEDNILVNRRMIRSKIKQLYPEFKVKQYEKDLKSHIIYKNDESSFAGALAPYTYSAKEVVEVIYNSDHLLIPFDLLYDTIGEPEIEVDAVNHVWQKRPDSLYVKDRNSYTQVTVMTKKERHRDLVRVKTAFGEDLVVTDNHPMIIDDTNIDNTVQAIDCENCVQHKINDNYEFTGVSSIDLGEILNDCEVYGNYIKYDKHVLKRFVAITGELGYILGFFIGDGNYINSEKYINFTQKDIATLEHINQLLFDSFGIIGKIYSKGDNAAGYACTVKSRALYMLLKEYFMIQDKAAGKTLPCNIFNFTEAFANGVLAGLIDSDGTVKDYQIFIRLASRSAILQATALFRHFGYSIGNGVHTCEFGQNPGYSTNYSVWGVNASRLLESTPIALSEKVKKLQICVNSPKYKKGGQTKVTSVVKIQVGDGFLTQNEYIYDITTETHTFALNNILAHNCVALTMYPFLNHGIETIGGLSAHPQNLDSYCGMYSNLIFAVSAQFAGAVATPEFLLCFDYFCRKEWGDNYWQEYDRIIEPHNEILAFIASDEYDKEYFEGCKLFSSEWTERLVKKYKQFADTYGKNGKFSDGTKTIRYKIHQCFQQVIYSINQPAAARGLQSAFVNFSYFDKPFFDGMFDKFVFPDENGTKPCWESLNYLQKDFMMWFNEERLRNIITFPVESYALVYQDGRFLDQEAADFVAAEYARGHSFFTYISDTVDSLSSCCRLKNKIQTKEFNYTNGNMGVQTGSKSVITLNLSRICQDWWTQYKKQYADAEKTNISLFYDDLKEYIRPILERVYIYHTAYNEILWDMYDAGLLPVYKAGFIHLDKQYLTIGINGLNQAAEFFGIDCNDNEYYAEFCQTLFSFIKEMNTSHKCKFNGHQLTFNTECIPAESLAIKNYNWDKEDGYWVPKDTNLYASYIYKPNDPKLDLYDKIRMHGANYIGDYLDGGSAAHINLSEHLSEKQYKKILEYAAKNGCQYFTFNIPNAECADCGYISKVPFAKCPKCGSTHVNLYDRIIGYLTKIANWSEGRQIEQKTRVYLAKDEIKK